VVHHPPTELTLEVGHKCGVVVGVFVRDTGGWRFTQIPQLLLPGDQPTLVSA
jgi:hypothetical protein